LTFQRLETYGDGMRSEAERIVPPRRREAGGLFKIVGRVAVALALAITMFLGPSHVSAAAPDANGAPAVAQPHHDDHADTGHDSPAASDTVYCNALTPGHASHANHGDELCEGYRVMCSTLANAASEIARAYTRLDVEMAPESLPPGRSPESLKEPPRTAA
jgi:hypothetical protein